LTISSQLRALAGRPAITRRNMIIALTLVSVFVIALFMRAFPAKYGFFLNEFDPYYDFKAANFIV
jgi:dolichyl-diphosphooligosaccharide--protein glycosyltransferase